LRLADIISEVKTLTEPVVLNEGLELIDVEFQREYGGWVLRVYIDKQGGVNLEDCRKVSRELGTNLDVKEIIHVPYNLEVSSPGLNRPLTREKDFQNYAGKMVRVKMKEAVKGRKNLFAKLRGIKNGKVLLTEIDGCDWEIDISNIQKTRLEVKL
jgi:ribosome maturation factor RimP